MQECYYWTHRSNNVHATFHHNKKRECSRRARSNPYCNGATMELHRVPARSYAGIGRCWPWRQTGNWRCSASARPRAMIANWKQIHHLDFPFSLTLTPPPHPLGLGPPLKQVIAHTLESFIYRCSIHRPGLTLLPPANGCNCKQEQVTGVKKVSCLFSQPMAKATHPFCARKKLRLRFCLCLIISDQVGQIVYCFVISCCKVSRKAWWEKARQADGRILMRCSEGAKQRTKVKSGYVHEHNHQWGSAKRAAPVPARQCTAVCRYSQPGSTRRIDSPRGKLFFFWLTSPDPYRAKEIINTLSCSVIFVSRGLEGIRIYYGRF